jgi:hypothetical protein
VRKKIQQEKSKGKIMQAQTVSSEVYALGVALFVH